MTAGNVSSLLVVVPDRVFTGHEVLENTAVCLRDGVIAWVGPSERAPAAGETIRLPGCTLTPGLIDAHVHLAPWMVYGLLSAGVTTVRDCGNDAAAVELLLSEITGVPLPTIEWSGWLMESSQVNWPSVARPHESVDEIRATVAEAARRGQRAIKLYANATPLHTAAAVAAAREHGLRVLCHLGVTDLSNAIAAGVDELQHLAGCLAVDVSIDASPDPDSIAAHVASAPVDHCPTLVVWQGLASLGAPRELRDIAERWVPPQMRAAWSDSYHATQPAAERLRRLDQLLERMRLIPTLRDAGRRIAVGSDSPFAGSVPGWSLHDEAGLLVMAGLTTLEVMTALTSGNAALVGVASERGVIAPGAAADLAAFGGDPTNRIGDLSDVRAVWKDGARIDGDRLARLAASAFSSLSPTPLDDIARRRFIPATVTPAG